MFLFGAGRVLHECAGGIEEVLQRELEVKERGGGRGGGAGLLGEKWQLVHRQRRKKTEHKSEGTADDNTVSPAKTVHIRR